MTSTSRNETYGDCLLNHQAYGELLDWFHKWRGLAPKGTAHNAAITLVLTKVARIVVGPALQPDNYIDASAYLGIAYECEQRVRLLASQATNTAEGQAPSGG